MSGSGPNSAIMVICAFDGRSLRFMKPVHAYLTRTGEEISTLVTMDRVL